jgi:hypothetical protein
MSESRILVLDLKTLPDAGSGTAAPRRRTRQLEIVASVRRNSSIAIRDYRMNRHGRRSEPAPLVSRAEVHYRAATTTGWGGSDLEPRFALAACSAIVSVGSADAHAELRAPTSSY